MADREVIMKLTRSALLMLLIMTFSEFLQAAYLFTPVEDNNQKCANGTERLRVDLKQTRKWVLAESIEFTKRSAAYVESDKKALKTLSTAGEVIDYINKLAKLDELPGAEIPMKYFKEILKAGNEIAKAGGRLSDQERKKLVDIVVTIKRVEVLVECAAVEVCENGKWVRKGFKQLGEPTSQKLKPLVKEEQGVLAGELWQKIENHSRSFAALQARFDADPCAGAVEAPPNPEPPLATDRCKVPPPCPECKEISDQLATACDRIKALDREIAEIDFQLTPFEERRDKAAQFGLTEKQLNDVVKQINEFNDSKQKYVSERKAMATETVKLREQLKTCEKDRCGKTATGNQSSGVLDPCLVGSWVSQTSTKIDGAVGAAGIKMTVEKDRTITIVYDGMEPWTYGNGESQVLQSWKGTATGHISAGDGVIIQQSVANSNDLTLTITQRGQTTTRKNNQLGIVIVPAPVVNLYQCNETTLRIQSNWFGNITENFLFVRQTK
jgi:hypothetical protein